MHSSRLPALVAGVLVLGLIGACDAGGGTASSTADAKPTQEDKAPVDLVPGDEEVLSVSGAAVAGFQPGEIPPIPLIELPDLSMLDSALAQGSIDVSQKIGTYPGLKVTPAHCDGSGGVITSGDTMLVYGDGSGSYTGPDGSMVNGGDGSGSFTLDGTTVVVNGDGSGVYNGEDGTTIVANGDGSGTYSGADGTAIVINGDGSGTYTGADDIAIVINGDGSGTYTDDMRDISIVNNGDGSGTYKDGFDEISIVNSGDGTALVNTDTVKADPLPPVPSVGKFPPMGVLKPIKACGTTITLQDGVLFDFGKSDIRPEAEEVLSSVVAAVNDTGASRIQVGGHTDSISSAEFNQTLSEQRAEAVAARLREGGVNASIETTGYGLTRPVAPNELNGKDNPAGRQLNRRVEIFIPN